MRKHPRNGLTVSSSSSQRAADPTPGRAGVVCVPADRAVQHGLLERHDVPRSLLLVALLATAFPISGVLLLAVAIVVSMLLVVDYLFQFLVASICAGLVAALLISAWLVQPIIQRGRLQLEELFDPDQADG